ncbi:MAG: GNAT family N-acetyltransferase [Atopobiaceae bacterium]|nr:GNAT family N-acetyltransferase [Atopobiaceae bacterium]
MQIRRAQQMDMPDIARLLEQVLMVHHNGRPDLFKPNTRKYTDEELAQIIDNDETPIFVALDDSTDEKALLGYAFCMREHYEGHNTMTDRDTLYVDDICVDEAARGKHVGTALYQHVIDFARAEGYYNVTLNVWTCNPGAQAFYEAMGMQPYRIGMETIL